MEDKFELESEDFYNLEETPLWMVETGLNGETLGGAIETIIFMSERPVSLDKIKSLINENIPLKTLHDSISHLEKEYEKNCHGVRLVEVAHGYQLRTKERYSGYLKNLSKIKTFFLSPTALEVLAIIAYREPISKSNIDKIRGVGSGHIIRNLMDKRLIQGVGRSDEIGKPVLYKTTSEFLELFNLKNLDDLPPEHELETMIERGVGESADIKTLVHGGEQKSFLFHEMDELDKLADSIKKISTETNFTTSLKTEEKKKKEGDKKTLSAFDLLEEHISRQLVMKVNREAQESKLLSENHASCSIVDREEKSFHAPLESDHAHLEAKVGNLEEKTCEFINKAKRMDLDFGVYEIS